MILLDLFLSGAELRYPVGPAIPLDFAVTYQDKTLCMVADWWTGDWGWGNKLVVVDASLEVAGTFSGLDPWLRISSLSDGTYARLLRHARYRVDTRRPEYLRQLRSLEEFEPNFDFSPWIQAVMDRPRIDPVKEYQARNLRLREVGRVNLLDEQGEIVDTLVIDELGNACTISEEGFLALFADAWAGYDDDARMTLQDFLSFVMSKQPPESFTLSSPEVFNAEGELERLATGQTSNAPAS